MNSRSFTKKGPGRTHQQGKEGTFAHRVKKYLAKFPRNSQGGYSVPGVEAWDKWEVGPEWPLKVRKGVPYITDVSDPRWAGSRLVGRV